MDRVFGGFHFDQPSSWMMRIAFSMLFLLLISCFLRDILFTLLVMLWYLSTNLKDLNQNAYIARWTNWIIWFDLVNETGNLPWLIEFAIVEEISPGRRESQKGYFTCHIKEEKYVSPFLASLCPKKISREIIFFSAFSGNKKWMLQSIFNCTSKKCNWTHKMQ